MQLGNYTKEEFQKADALDRCIAELNGEEGAVSMLALDLDMVEWLNNARDLLSQVKQDYEEQLDSIKPDRKKRASTKIMMHQMIDSLYGTDVAKKPEQPQRSLWGRVSRVFDRVVPPQGPELAPAYRREDNMSTLSLHGEEETYPVSQKNGIICIVATLNGEEHVLDLLEGDTIIGASNDADVQLKDRDGYISGKHAKISKTADGLYITDLESTNGTFLNGEKLNTNIKTPISVGDEIMLAGTLVKIDRI